MPKHFEYNKDDEMYVKYFKHNDPAVAKHVEEMVSRSKDIVDNPTTVKRDITIYANNNKDKPFSMTYEDLENRWKLLNRPEIVKMREQDKSKVEEMYSHSISDSSFSEIAHRTLKEIEDKQSKEGFFDKIRKALSLRRNREEKEKLEELKEIAERE